MSGCGFIVLLGVFERLSGQNIPLEVYIYVLALLVCVSFYLAWREERIACNSVIRLSEFPEFRGKIVKDIIQFGKTKTNVGISYIALVVSFVNVKEARATIDHFELIVVVEDKEYKARNVPAYEKQPIFKSHDKWGLPYFAKEYKDLSQDNHTPHERGITAEGWLLFVLTDVIIYDALDCIFRLTIIDAFGRANHLEESRRSKHKTDLTELLTVIEEDIHTKLEPAIKSPEEISQQNSEKRKYKIESLRDFIREGEEYYNGQLNPITPRGNTYNQRVERFLEQYFDRSYIERFQEENIVALQDFLKELLDS